MAELVSKTYSEAIFNIALEEGRLSDIQNEFEFVASILNEYPDFYEILKTPKINATEKKAVLQDAFGDKISQTLLNFLKIIIDKKRGTEILEIKADFDDRIDRQMGIAKATVESVVALSDEQLNILTSNLNRITGKEIRISTKINPELLGGMVVKVGDKVIDGSVKFKLEGMLESLTQIII